MPSETLNVGEKLPDDDAVPVQVPFEFNVRPEGREPETTDHVRPSPSASSAESAEGAEPGESEIVGEEEIVGDVFAKPIENEDEAGEPTPSETVAENENDWFDAVEGGV